MNIAIGSDHAGFELKEKIKTYFKEHNIGYEDFGPFDSERVDYPDYGHKVALSLIDESFNFGIVICGSGNGINMTVNKHSHIRAALCWNEELAALARQHNDANILTLPARFIEDELSLAIVKTFLSHDFEGGRHEKRVSKISLS